MKWKLLSCVQLFATSGTIQSVEFSRPDSRVGCLSLLHGSSQPAIEPRSPALQADSLPVEPQGKTKYTGVGKLPFLQRIFPTQESNQGFLHCTWIPYQLNYQGSPIYVVHLCWFVYNSEKFFKVFTLDWSVFAFVDMGFLTYLGKYFFLSDFKTLH